MSRESIGFGNLTQSKPVYGPVKEHIVSPYVVREKEGYVVVYCREKDKEKAEEWVVALSERGPTLLQFKGTRTGKVSRSSSNRRTVWHPPEDDDYIDDMYSMPERSPSHE